MRVILIKFKKMNLFIFKRILHKLILKIIIKIKLKRKNLKKIAKQNYQISFSLNQ